jgi:CysZ protein
LWVSLTDSLQYFGLLLGLNLLGLLGFVVSGGVGIVALWLINGFLLAREYFTLVALRRVGAEAARDMRRAHRFRLWGAGLLMALPLSVPLLNLFVPVIGAAVFTHLFHAMSQRR